MVHSPIKHPKDKLTYNETQYFIHEVLTQAFNRAGDAVTNAQARNFLWVMSAEAKKKRDYFQVQMFKEQAEPMTPPWMENGDKSQSQKESNEKRVPTNRGILDTP
jgi:hypothetical protein